MFEGRPSPSTWRIVCALVLLLAVGVSMMALRQHTNADQLLPSTIPPSVPSGPLVREKAGDYWADVIIGKPDFSEITPNEVVSFKVFHPGGVAVDRSVDPGLAYVWDAGNSRILGIDLAKCYAKESPCHADIVIGQPTLFDYAACNGDSGFQNFPRRQPASAATLCGLPAASTSPAEHPTFVNMVVDGTGNLYVPDSFNHRVLLYERPFETDSKADAVWGQQDFTGMSCNLGFPKQTYGIVIVLSLPHQL